MDFNHHSFTGSMLSELLAQNVHRIKVWSVEKSTAYDAPHINISILSRSVNGVERNPTVH
eukprot:5495815-Pyramimonas_sp.AAC.2